MANKETDIVATAASPFGAGPFAASDYFGGSGPTVDWQSGYGANRLDKMTPEEQALNLGKYRPGYDSNQAGSAERAFDQYLDRLTPDLLINRYEHGDRHGTDRDERQRVAYQTAKSMLGRPPTSNEFAQLLPAFMGPNGLTTGRAYVAQMAERDARSPEALMRKAPQHYGEVEPIFQEMLKRGASKEELNHFGSLLASGQIDPFELKSFVQQLPEYRTQQDTQFRQGLSGELQGYDDKFFNREKENVLSTYARSGIQNSSALDYALTDMMGKIAEQRGQYLAGLSADQYGGNKTAARQDYMGNMDRYLKDQDYNRNRSDQGMDQLTNRGYAAQDYKTQMDDYTRMMNGQNQGRNVLHSNDWLQLGLQGADTGAKMYGSYAYLNG